MSRIKKALIVLIISLIAVLFSGCAGSITYQILYDDEGGYHSSVEVVVDPTYFTEQEIAEIDTFLRILSEFTIYDLDDDQPENTYLLYAYLTPEELEAAQANSKDPEDGFYTRSDTKHFFNRKIQITDKTVFYGLFEYLTGESVPESGSYMDIVINGFTGSNSGGIVYPGLAETLTDVSFDSAQEMGLYYISGNNYRGYFGLGAEKIRQSGYNFFAWDLTGEPNKLITYGQKIPNPTGWYTMLIVAAFVFIGGSILFVKFVVPKIDKNMERIRENYRTGAPDTYNPYEYTPPVDNTPPLEDPFEEYNNNGSGMNNEEKDYNGNNNGETDPFPGYNQNNKDNK